MVSDQELGRIIGPILSRRLGDLGPGDLSFETGEDHDGDPALFVIVRRHDPEQEIDAVALLDSIRDIREALWTRGDVRLPYLRYTTDEATS
ncbi:hypothetical protein [Blastochloris sulfoviridis]|uniref:Uncharacterized protein n=1 Tax=Blastochloris sulfoviridis TaxID=50712 RepID=A0A5M6I0Y7_9HYPH|nr:hypothetical protein [Blastochloris sulfoviridis]KAA5601851.1 hypothetical protein F1193_07940 [Blastochloris sulfoviridis]